MYDSTSKAGAAIFAGLKLDQQLINQIFKRDFIQGSVIYDQIFQEGEAIGEARGERAMMMKMLNRRLGLDGSSKTLPISLQSQIESLSLSKIDSLAEVLLDFAAEYTHHFLNSSTEESYQLAPGQSHQTGQATNPRSILLQAQPLN
jgi:predicted transposase YdaD